LGYLSRCCTAEQRGVAAVAAQRQSAHEAGRERVAAPCRVDDVDREGGHIASLVRVDNGRALGAAGGCDTADPALEQRSAARLEVAGAGAGEDLLLVGQQVVEL